MTASRTHLVGKYPRREKSSIEHILTSNLDSRPIFPTRDMFFAVIFRWTPNVTLYVECFTSIQVLINAQTK